MSFSWKGDISLWNWYRAVAEITARLPNGISQFTNFFMNKIFGIFSGNRESAWYGGSELSEWGKCCGQFNIAYV